MFEMVMQMLMAMGDSVSFDYDEVDHFLDVTGEDFLGFDEDWEEQFDEDFDEAAFSAFTRWLGAHCDYQEGDYYIVYHFDGFSVRTGYASFDI